MSRIGNQPVVIPEKVDVSVEGRKIRVKGPKGELVQEFPPELAAALKDKMVVITRSGEESRVRALHGLYRALVQNMITGVTQGFSKRLELHGVGYRALLQGKDLQLQLGFSKPVVYPAPPGITFQVEGTEKIVISGIHRQLVGQVAAEIRSIRPVEPYKGKGMRYQGEQFLRKAGKAAKGGTVGSGKA